MAILNTIKNTLLQSPVKVIGGAVKNVVNSAVNAYTAPSKAVINAVSTPPMRPPVQQADGFSNRTSTSMLPPVPAPKPVAQAAPIRPPVAAPQPSVKPVVQAPAVQPMRPPTVTPVSSSPMTVPSPIAMPPQAPTARVSEAPPMRPPQPTMSSVTPVVKQEDRSAQLKALQDAYVRSLNVSGEEQDAQRALDNLTYSKEMGLNNIRDQAIPMGFITGQSASVERRAQEKMIPLQQQLAMAQARRAAMSQGVKAQLDFAQKEAEQQAAIERERSKPIEVGNSLIQFDPETGTYKTMFSAPEKPQNPITLGEGQVLIDPVTGKQIAAGNPKTVNKIGELTPAQANAAFKIADDYEKASKDISALTGNYNRLLSVQNNNTPAGDIALIFSFMKIQDPGSVVREGEYANAQNAAAVPDQLRNAYNKVVSGTRLTPEQRLDFVNQAKAIYGATLEQQKQIDSQFSARAQQFGIPPEYVVRDQGSYTMNNANQSSINDSIEALSQKAGVTQEKIDALRSYRGPDGSKFSEEDIKAYLRNKQGLTNVTPVQTQNGATLVSKNPNPTKVITTSSGRYDFSNYATDPNWGNAVKSHLSKIPNTTDPNQITAFIKSQAPSSPITGEMVLNSARKFGVDPKIILAIAKQEANYATLGRAARTFNPGNVGNVDSGSNINWGSWQAGLDALARNISRRNLS